MAVVQLQQLFWFSNAFRRSASGAIWQRMAWWRKALPVTTTSSMTSEEPKPRSRRRFLFWKQRREKFVEKWFNFNQLIGSIKNPSFEFLFILLLFNYRCDFHSCFWSIEPTSHHLFDHCVILRIQQLTAGDLWQCIAAPRWNHRSPQCLRIRKPMASCVFQSAETSGTVSCCNSLSAW